MPLRRQTYEFDAEVERLESELEEIANEAVNLDDGNPLKRQKLQEGQQLDTQLSGVLWAQTAHESDIDTWDEQANSITFGGLSGGEFAHVEDTLVQLRQESNGEIGPGALRIQNVAKGTVEAPYIENGMSHQEKVAAVGSLPNAFLQWANARVDELTSVEGNGDRRFSDLLAAARERQT